jgi:hypothetical protein
VTGMLARSRMVMYFTAPSGREHGPMPIRASMIDGLRKVYNSRQKRYACALQHKSFDAEWQRKP